MPMTNVLSNRSQVPRHSHSYQRNHQWDKINAIGFYQIGLQAIYLGDLIERAGSSQRRAQRADLSLRWTEDGHAHHIQDQLSKCADNEAESRACCPNTINRLLGGFMSYSSVL